MPDYSTVESAEYLVDNRLYFDEETLVEERQRILNRSWLFVCHESELARSGDFITTTRNGVPLIITKGRDGTLIAHVNVCLHRSGLLVREESGHCSTFRCPYHYWSYSLDGELIGVPAGEAYDDTGFSIKGQRLASVNCASVLGLIFVQLDPSGTSLEDWLSPPVINMLSAPLAAAEFGVLSTSEHEIAANWKLQAENVRDGYHVPFVHPFFRNTSPPGDYTLAPNGHTIQILKTNKDAIDAETWATLCKEPFPDVSVGEGYVINIFPSLLVFFRWNFMALFDAEPINPTSFRYRGRILCLKSDTEEQLAVRRFASDTWFNHPLEREDDPILEEQQRAIGGYQHVPYSVIARGGAAKEGVRGDDNRLRHFWQQYRSMMDLPTNAPRKS